MNENYRLAHVVSVVVIILLVTHVPVRPQTKEKQKSARQVTLTPLSLTRFDEIEDQNKIFHPRGGSVDWGLALSGGGIRSGSYSVGVMKALYDHGLFEKLDAISTVSGGGYASYWLYGLYEPKNEPKKEQFGERAFGKKSFLVNTCKLQNVSDMHSFFKMARSFLRSRPGAFDDYRNSIHRTFGREDDALRSRQIDYYQEAIRKGWAPYFFVNASMYSRELVDFAKSIEMTPEHIGNPVLGYGRWNDGGAINFADSITISAAPKPKVRNDVANFAPHTLCFKKEPSKDDEKDSLGRTACKRQPLFLWDGGKSENLGALPLIRRGLKNVIIVDAEHDPKYIYDAYFDLQRSLRAVSIDFCVPGIDGCGGEKPNSSTHQTGVMKGLARNKVTGTETTIFYLKMMRSLNVFPSDFHTFVMTSKNAKERQKRIQKEYEKGFRLYSERKKVNCEGAAVFEADADVYRYRVNYYGYFILQSKLLWITTVYTDAVYDFPQTTTFDQSYYPDQMEAFIGLGFLQGKALSEEIGKLD